MTGFLSTFYVMGEEIKARLQVALVKKQQSLTLKKFSYFCVLDNVQTWLQSVLVFVLIHCDPRVALDVDILRNHVQLNSKA